MLQSYLLDSWFLMIDIVIIRRLESIRIVCMYTRVIVYTTWPLQRENVNPNEIRKTITLLLYLEVLLSSMSS
jgi:hypothetical protein